MLSSLTPTTNISKKASPVIQTMTQDSGGIIIHTCKGHHIVKSSFLHLSAYIEMHLPLEKRRCDALH